VAVCSDSSSAFSRGKAAARFRRLPPRASACGRSADSLDTNCCKCQQSGSRPEPKPGTSRAEGKPNTFLPAWECTSTHQNLLLSIQSSLTKLFWRLKRERVSYDPDICTEIMFFSPQCHQVSNSSCISKAGLIIRTTERHSSRTLC